MSRSKSRVLIDLMQAAETILKQYESLATVAANALNKCEVYMSNTTDPKEILDMFRRIHDMQVQSINSINGIIEKFPMEHTVQEVQMLDAFRNLTEKQKQQLIQNLEAVQK